MDDMEVEYVTLEDGSDYFIVDIIEKYVYLKKEDDEETFEIREVTKNEDGEEFFVELAHQDEYEKALLLFTNKYVNQ